jgi:phage tail-like protein
MANTQNRAYAAAHFALELDDRDEVGLFKSIEGGSIKTDVMTYQTGDKYDRWRQLGKPKFEDLKLQIGMAMSGPFYTWIEHFFTGIPDRRTGAVVAADFTYQEKARREFRDALIKEIVFPKLDATDKGPAYMSVSIAVEDMVYMKAKNQKLNLANRSANQQKVWSANNFRFKLDTFPDARVNKIDSFTIKQNILEYHSSGNEIAQLRAPIKCPSQVEFPNLVFYIPEPDSASFVEHFNRRAIKGERPNHLTGSITTFDASKVDTFILSFAGADILSITPDKADAGSEDIKNLKVEIYTEKMEFKWLGAGGGPTG